MTRRPALLLALLATAAPAAVAAVPAVAATGDKTVLIEDYLFKPSRVIVRSGRTVTWRFQDGGVAHNATGAAGIRSGDLRRGTYRKRFRKPGTYRYVCTFHPSMRGTVVVR